MIGGGGGAIIYLTTNLGRGGYNGKDPNIGCATLFEVAENFGRLLRTEQRFILNFKMTSIESHNHYLKQTTCKF